MSVVTHVVPQTFSEGQILITPAINITHAQDVSNSISVAQLVPSTAAFTATPIQLSEEPSMEKDKQTIYSHPMFPLMALMFERCEQASAAYEFPSPDGIVADIQAFVMHQEKEKKSLLSGDEDLDNLMIKAIQVLRIHLLELEKVNDLCKDFCQRYTSCLKGKLQSENLLRTESDYDQSMFDEPPPEEMGQPVQTIVSSAGGVILQQPFQTTMTAMPTLGPGQIMSGGTIYQMVQTPQGLVAQPVQIQTSIGTPIIHGSTPLSQIGVSPQTVVSTPSVSSASVVNTLNSAGSGFDSDDDDPGGKKKNKRGVLPKSATQIMKSWLFQHIVHPYPTEDEKRQIAAQTNLTLLQVNNWFINARRRILQPMLDSGIPETSKAKKAKTQSKPPVNQRFWPFSSSGNPTTITAGSTSESSESITSSPPSTSTFTTYGQASLGQTIVIPPGAFLTTDGQIVSLQGANMAAMLNHVKQTSPSPPLEDTPGSKPAVPSDTNNNSHNTDSESNNESEDLT